MYAREELQICVHSPFISLQIWIVIDYFLTFALAKETDDPAATLVVVAKEIFEIIDIDKQKCSNKRLGNERPNRQLRPLLRQRYTDKSEQESFQSKTNRTKYNKNIDNEEFDPGSG